VSSHDDILLHTKDWGLKDYSQHLPNQKHGLLGIIGKGQKQSNSPGFGGIVRIQPSCHYSTHYTYAHKKM
jgi:hypothetical protein